MTMKYSLGKVRLNTGGYDAYGAYYGHGLPIYRAIPENCNERDMLEFRAVSRNAAKQHVKEIDPSATFYR